MGRRIKPKPTCAGCGKPLVKFHDYPVEGIKYKRRRKGKDVWVTPRVCETCNEMDNRMEGTE